MRRVPRAPYNVATLLRMQQLWRRAYLRTRFTKMEVKDDRCEACFPAAFAQNPDGWRYTIRPGSQLIPIKSLDNVSIPGILGESDETYGVRTTSSSSIDSASLGTNRTVSGPPADGLSWLTQRKVLAFFDIKYEANIRKGTVGLDPELWYERGLICMLVIVSHYLQERFFGMQTAGFGGSRAQHRLAPPKTYERMFCKIQSDYVDRPPPAAMYNKDPIRKSIVSATAADQAEVWANIGTAGLEVLAVKNTFTMSDKEAQEETQGMMQILVNFAFRPKALDGKPLTFGAMLADRDGFSAAVEAAKKSSGRGHGHAFDKAATLFAKLPGLDTEEVVIIAEIQLHLQYYLNRRKMTHLWFKIQRANTLEDLEEDCTKYRYVDEGERTTNEALWAEAKKKEAATPDPTLWKVEAPTDAVSAVTADTMGESASAGSDVVVWYNLPEAVSNGLTSSFVAWKAGDARHERTNLKMDGELCVFNVRKNVALIGNVVRKLLPPDNIETVSRPSINPEAGTAGHGLATLLRTKGRGESKNATKKAISKKAVGQTPDWV